MPKAVTCWLLFLVLFCAPCVSYGAEPSCSGPSIPQGSLSAVIDGINGSALVDRRSYSGPWPLTKSPFADWYARFVTSTGSSSPPTSDEKRVASALIRQMRATPGIHVAAGLWAQSPGTTLDAQRKKQLEQELCVNVVTLKWNAGGEERPPVEALMVDWLRAQMPGGPAQMRDSRGFVDDLSLGATLATKRANHALNVLVATSVAAPARAVHSSPYIGAIPYYDDGKVQGIRVKMSGVSLFLFTASRTDLLSFVGSFDNGSDVQARRSYAVERWKSVLGQFKSTQLGMVPLAFSMHGRRGFMPSLDMSLNVSSYGTTVSTTYNSFTGLGQSDVALDANGLSVFTVAGVEGTDAPEHLTYDITPNIVAPEFSLPQLLYYVVDDKNGLILSFGFQVARP